MGGGYGKVYIKDMKAGEGLWLGGLGGFGIENFGSFEEFRRLLIVENDQK